MTIKDQLVADMKQAMKDREAGKLRLAVIRMARNDIRNAEINGKKDLTDINGKKDLTDSEVISILRKGVKMREDSITEFTKGGRQDLVDQNKAEIAILEKYLPAAMGQEELTALVTAAIKETGATGPKDMGKVMKAVMAKAEGRADGKQINTVVRGLLK
jgi:uncharacterized protein YqeY